jgi:hypothetical protein
MKVKVTEIRKTKFIDPPNVIGSLCRIDITYEVYTGDGVIKTLHSEKSLEAYLKYLEERQKDYHKVIKEIEI